MTDRIRHLTITLDRDYRDDDLEPVIAALKMNRAVAEVTPLIVQVTEHLARAVVRAEIRGELHRAIEAVFDAKKEQTP